MQTLIKLLYITLLYLLSYTNTYAIDCTKIENDNLSAAICNDKELLDLDAKLNDLYNKLTLKHGKDDLKDSQLEWLKFIQTASCSDIKFYPECKVDQSLYEKKNIKHFYQQRIKFLQDFDPYYSKFNRLWHHTAGSLGNLYIGGSLICSSHVDGIENCEYTGLLHNRKYIRFNDNCIFMWEKNANNPEHNIRAHCVSKDNDYMVSLFPFADIESSWNISAIMQDLESYTNWYPYDNYRRKNKKPKPKYKSPTFKSMLTEYGSLSNNVQSILHARYKDYK